MWSKRQHGAQTSDTTGDASRAATPGKHTLTEALPAVQRKAAAGNGVDVAAVAQHGVSGPPQALPHGERIQALFGSHDVSGVRAHIGGQAVADAVVAGKPAGGILDQMAGGSSGSTGVQRKPGDPAKAAPTPVGTHKKTDFGEYWVVPDGTKPADAKVGQKGELIEQTKFTALEAVWTKVKDGTGKLLITETDKNGGAHAGFKAANLPRIGMLMSKPKGRELVTGLVNGSKKCMIRPAPARSSPVHRPTRPAGSAPVLRA